MAWFTFNALNTPVSPETIVNLQFMEEEREVEECTVLIKVSHKRPTRAKERTDTGHGDGNLRRNFCKFGNFRENFIFSNSF